MPPSVLSVNTATGNSANSSRVRRIRDAYQIGPPAPPGLDELPVQGLMAAGDDAPGEPPERIGDYRVHPLANEFPMIEGEEFGQLRADVREHGMRTPILVTADQSTLIDGRNRLRAALAEGAEIPAETAPADWGEREIASSILSANLTRRHLTDGQRAFIGLRFRELFAAEARRRQGTRTDLAPGNNIRADRRASREDRSDERAARIVGTSGRSIQKAARIRGDAPDLEDRVRSGALSLDAADRQARERARPVREETPPVSPAGEAEAVPQAIRAGSVPEAGSGPQGSEPGTPSLAASQPAGQIAAPAAGGDDRDGNPRGGTEQASPGSATECLRVLLELPAIPVTELVEALGGDIELLAAYLDNLANWASQTARSVRTGRTTAVPFSSGD